MYTTGLMLGAFEVGVLAEGLQARLVFGCASGFKWTPNLLEISFWP